MTDELVSRIVGWASSRDDVRSAILIGSRARSQQPADEWSDTDIILLATDPAGLVDDATWPGDLGDVGITFVEQTPVRGVRERRVLFIDGRDVDFAIMPAAATAELATMGAHVLARGFRVLVDKDGLLDGLPAGAPENRQPSSGHAFSEAVSDFWYHALWTARKLARGEIFTAKACCDGHMKWILIRVLGWHAGEVDTWHDGRFLEQWADGRALSELRGAYAAYDGADVERALFATMDLFAWVARETGERLGCPYATSEEELARRLVDGALTGSR